MSTQTPLDLDELERLAEAATPGPWERGHVWLRAGVMEQFGKGKCAYCDERHGEPVVSETMDINGTRMFGHIHHDADPWRPENHVSGSDYTEVTGNFDYESGGILREADTAFIAAANPSTVRSLIDLARLGMAWQEAEKRGWTLWQVWRGPSGNWGARAVGPGAMAVTEAGPTPTAALQALTAKLRERES